MCIEQFRRFPSEVSVYDTSTYYEYTELISKNNQHRFKDLHARNKSVEVYAICDSEKCLVKILDFYISKLPEKPSAFYLRPLTKVPTEPDKLWFANVPIGVNTLRKMMSRMSKIAELSTTYTNHSLRATSASFICEECSSKDNSGEEWTQECSRSACLYEHTTADQHRAVTRVLDSANATFTEEDSLIAVHK